MNFTAASKLFKAFHGREAAYGELMQLEMVQPENLLAVGKLNGLIYEALGDGKKYIHQFRKDARPVLFVSDDGKQAYILAGEYRFTDRGFVDRGHKRSRKK